MVSCNPAAICVFISLLTLLLCDCTTGQVPTCLPNLRVPKTTKMAVVSQELRIDCPVEHCGRFPPVTWCKMANASNICEPVGEFDHLKTVWKNITETNGMSQLVFKNISEEDDGIYRCNLKEMTEHVSHHINVSVQAQRPLNGNKTSNSTDVPPGSFGDNQEVMEPIIYITTGVAAFVTMVIGITLLLFRCRGSKYPSGDTMSENQRTSTQMSNLPLTLTRFPENPRGHTQSLPLLPATRSPCISNNSIGWSSPSGLPTSAGSLDNRAVLCGDDTYGNWEVADRSPLLYVSLNLQVPSQTAVRPSELQGEECSEYSAIRVT